jgi:hypothetical protein
MSGKAYAWQLLGMMPTISKAAAAAQTTEWLAETFIDGLLNQDGTACDRCTDRVS